MSIEKARIAPEPQKPAWWTYPYVWMVLMGPVLVVIAALCTAFIAIEGADHVLTGDLTTKRLSPEQEAKNHATTRTPVPAALSIHHQTPSHRGDQHE